MSLNELQFVELNILYHFQLFPSASDMMSSARF